MCTARFNFGLLLGTATRRTAGLVWSVLAWSSLDACAQLIGIEVYDDHAVLETEPGKLANAGASTFDGPDAGVAAPGAGGDDTASRGGSAGIGVGSESGLPAGGDDAGGRGGDSSGGGDAGRGPGGAGASGGGGSNGGGGTAECEPGQRSCQEGNAFVCDRGDWDLVDACSSTEICRSGECVEAQRELGHASVLTGTVIQPSETLLLYRLPVLEHDAILTHFGVVGDVDGVQARLVLYGDGADGLAPAGPVVAQTGGLSFALAAGRVVTVAPASPDTVLSAGASYWLGVITAESTTLRAAADAPTALRVVSFAPFNAPFAPAETGQLGPRLHLNLFIGVRELP
jgi:hypothetical protein